MSLPPPNLARYKRLLVYFYPRPGGGICANCDKPKGGWPVIAYLTYEAKNHWHGRPVCEFHLARLASDAKDAGLLVKKDKE